MKSSNSHSQSTLRSPLLWFLLPWIAGLVAVSKIDVIQIKPLLTAIVLCSGMVLLLLSRWNTQNTVFLVQKSLSFIGFFFLAMLWTSTENEDALIKKQWNGLPAREAHIEITVNKIISSVPLDEGMVDITVAGEFLSWATTPATPKPLKTLHCSVLTDPSTDVIQSNSVLKLRGILVPPDNPLSKTFLLRDGSITHQIHPGTPNVLDTTKQTINHRMLAVLSKGAPPEYPYSDYLKSMLTGEKQYLGYLNKQKFQQAGMMHFFAISGFHLSIIALVSYSILSLLRLSKPLTHTGMLIICGLYVWATGSPVSAQRAYLMLVFFFAAYLIKRKPDPLGATIGAACLILVLSPEQLFEPGFQLSFAVVIGILVYAIPLNSMLNELFLTQPSALTPTRTHNFIRNISRFFIGTFAVSWTAFWISAPIISLYFETVSFQAILLNTMLAPLLSLVMVTGFLSLTIGLPGQDSLSEFINHAAWILLHWIDSIIQFANQIVPVINFQTSAPAAFSGLFIVLGIGLYWNLSNDKYRWAQGFLPFISLMVLWLG